MRVRAKENHPLYKAMQELFDKMDELGIKIDLHESIICQGVIFKGERWELCDLEDDFDSTATTPFSRPLYELPPTFEFKLIKEEKE